MNVNAFTWILVAFPVYLILSGRFPLYINLAAKEVSPESPDGNGDGDE